MKSALKPAIGPHFLGIGAPKAGTTWLDSLLRAHPDIWLPPIKELHFLDDYFVNEAQRGFGRYFSNNPWVKNRWRRNFRAVAKYALRYPSPQRLMWAVRYLGQPLSFNWYSKLFPEQGFLAGEITPGYCILSKDQVEEVARHLPNLKVLLMLRNPVDRAWSHCRMELLWRRGLEIDQVSETEIRQFLFNDKGVLARSEYPRIVQSWCGAYGKSALFVGLLDEVKSDPGKFAKEVFDFLELESHRFNSDWTVNMKKFEGKGVSMPVQIREDLSHFYREEIEHLNALLPAKKISDRWLT